MFAYPKSGLGHVGVLVMLGALAQACTGSDEKSEGEGRAVGASGAAGARNAGEESQAGKQAVAGAENAGESNAAGRAGDAGVVAQAGNAQAGETNVAGASEGGSGQAGEAATGTDTAPGGDGGGGSGPVDSDGPYLVRSGSGILHCGDITWSPNGAIVSSVDWGIIHVTNVGQSGIADITVTVTDGTTSYVEHEQFSMLSDVEYDLSVGVPLVPKSSASKPSPWPRTQVVLSLPGAPTDITLMDDWPTLSTPSTTSPGVWVWEEPTGPSTTTLDPPPCQ